MIEPVHPLQGGQLDGLKAFIRAFDQTRRTCRQFWDEYDTHAKGLHAAAMHDADLADRYFDLLDSATKHFPRRSTRWTT